ncbi:hypothetical protein D3C85_1207440 [compost metagenome]
MHRDLHALVEILDAKAQAVKAQLMQVGQAFGSGRARVHFDRDLGIRFETESAPQISHEARKFLIGQEGRRAAAEMQLRHGHALPQLLHVQGDFACQGVQIAGRAAMMAGHHLVTGAVIADGLAERDMDVKRQRLGRTRRAPLPQRQPVVLSAKAAVISIGRGVRGVSRPILVQPRQQLGGEKRLGDGGRRRFWRVWA